MASTDPLLSTSADQWDADLWLLGTPNGTVELRTGVLREARQGDCITKVTSVTPDPNCPIPLWLAFLDKIFVSDKDLIDYAQRASGYILTGSIIEHAMFFLWGKGGNGKSVFWGTLAKILNDYHTSAVIETFTETTGDRHPTEMAKLAGMRLVTTVETEDGRRWNESRITSSTGGDKISARFMRQDFFDFIPMFKLMVIGNYKPGLKAVSQAMKRRLQMWPFLYEVTEEEKDLDFVDKLKDELPGILSWMIQGCLLWQQEKLKPPQAVIETTTEYFASENTIRQWIDDCCITGEDLFQSSNLLFESFEAWARRRGEYVGSLKKFTQRLEAEGFKASRRVDERTGDRVRGFWGIIVRPPEQEREKVPGPF
jgi:putative DNA primase/helicase